MAKFLQFRQRMVHLLPGLCKRNSIRFVSDDCNKIKGLVLGSYEKEKNVELKLTPAGQKFDESVQGKLLDWLKESNFMGRLGEAKMVTDLDPNYPLIAVTGTGREGIGFNEFEFIDEGRENVRKAASIGAKLLQEMGCNHIYVDSMEYPEQVAEGSALATWRYQDNKKFESRLPSVKLDVFGSTETDAWTRGLFKAEAQNLARRLTDTPANQMTPTIFAQAAVDALCPCGVNVEIRNVDWIRARNLNSFLKLANSSCEPPVFLEVSYSGGGSDERPIALVGEGITFDSGGLCLKKKDGFLHQRGTMAGAAVIVAAIRAAAALSLPLNITGLIPLCENMPSALAFKPGDVITCNNGTTVSIDNTYSAGILMLADTFTYAQQTYKPKMIIDVATISAGLGISLGGSASATFTNSHFLWKEMQKAGALTGDRVWRMPLWNFYTKNVTDDPHVNLINKEKGCETACLAAAFLNEFVECTDWCHLDIGGTGMVAAHHEAPYYKAYRMTGRPTRTLIQFLVQMACPEEQRKAMNE